MLIIFKLSGNDLNLGLIRDLGNFRETIAIILRHLLFNNGWGQKKKKKEKKKKKWIMLVIWCISSKLCAIEYAP